MTRTYLFAPLAFAISFPACSDTDTVATESGPASASLGTTYSVFVDARADYVELRRNDTVLLTLTADAFSLGTVSEVLDSVNYDPEPLLRGAPGVNPPDGLEFLAGKSFSITQAAADRIDLLVDHAGGVKSKVTFTLSSDGRFAGQLTPVDAKKVAYLRLNPKATTDEAFYGLGEWFDTVNHRGQLRAMQLELDPGIESSYNEAHVPIPLVIGTRGWGLFVENPYPAAFDIAKTNPERVETTFGTGLASAEGLTFHLFAAERPLDITRHYYDITGYPKLPARWGLGPTVWRDENVDQAEVENDLKTMRDLDLPTTAIWVDRPYASAVNTFDFHPTQFPDAQAMINTAHDLGFRMSLWHTPYLDEKTMPTPAEIAPLLSHAEDNGYFPAPRGLLLNKWGTPIDFTNEAAYAWWQDLIKKYTNMGIEGFKLDYGEDIVPGVFGARNVWQFSDGSDERTMHVGYKRLYHRVYAELFPDEGSFILSRAGTYGDQKYTNVIWPGDLDASFARHRENVDENGNQYTAVGGLPAALIAGLNLGPSGYPFFGSDTGGYRHSPPDKELFVRWFQITALSPVMQIGTSTNDVAWEPKPGNGFDAEMLEWYRIYTRLHLRLFPYVWTYAKRIATDGRPIQRPLGLAYPEMGTHPDDTFMLGDHLLVAPIVERGAVKRDVSLPAGDWMNWWTGEITTGGATVSLDAPLDTLPIFLAKGGIVPLLRPTIDSLSPTTKPGTAAGEVDSYATTPGILWARVAPGPASSFALFDGAEVGQEDTGAEVVLTTKDGTEFKQGFFFEIAGFGALPKSVEDAGAALASQPDLASLEAASQGFVFAQERGGTLWIKVPSGTHSIRITR